MSAPPNITIIEQDKAASIAQEFHVMHTANEFILTVIEVIPQMEYSTSDTITPEGKSKKVARLKTSGIIQRVVGRFGMSPAAFKKMVTVSSTNLRQYENKFGEIAINPPEGLQ